MFGVANVTKMLHELPPPHREDCVNSLAYEADARVQDPVYGCVGAISVLQQQVFTSFLLSSPFLAHETSLKRSHTLSLNHHHYAPLKLQGITQVSFFSINPLW